ncbi:MAG: hypothetical protein MUC94_16155 [bacterium]|jgi:hypothetical protein|nr:hypothetical protein [bacterium]
MNWKDIIKTLLGALLPLLFTQLVSHYPDFPLYSEDFVSIILWIIGLIIGGWGLNAMYMKGRIKKAGYDYKKLVAK